ncbi:hypothetical protein [Paraburkholderia sp. J8-2]|uniref:hypothetical protein n=1 Tax=Paraburkholderia sp. J8-2 TaxID=2805440 RepID=UPI002AB65CEA|nr:hypothetical protein [Paraburkholderia sp. J8-2]
MNQETGYLESHQTKVPDQKEMFYRAHRQIADGNEAFMDLVRDGMTREELARNIERRPSLWKRFEGFLDVLPCGAVVTHPEADASLTLA